MCCLCCNKQRKFLLSPNFQESPYQPQLSHQTGKPRFPWDVRSGCRIRYSWIYHVLITSLSQSLSFNGCFPLSVLFHFLSWTTADMACSENAQLQTCRAPAIVSALSQSAQRVIKHSHFLRKKQPKRGAHWRIWTILGLKMTALKVRRHPNPSKTWT